MESSHMETILKWPVPCTYREIQVFLGFTNFYRRFIANYSNIATLLTALLKGSKNGKKTGSYILTKEAKEAFRKLKATFAMAPVLQHFDPEKPICIETDASGFAVAAILSQPCPPCSSTNLTNIATSPCPPCSPTNIANMVTSHCLPRSLTNSTVITTIMYGTKIMYLNPESLLR